jgi:4-aminobutyrate aminotransferase-like enzyme
MDEDLEKLRTSHPGRIGTIRGRGAMRGIEIIPPRDSLTLCRAMLAEGYLVLPSGLEGEVLSLTPPLTLTRTQWEGTLAALDTVL